MSEEMIEVIARLVAPEWFTKNGEPPIINNYPDQHLGYQAIARDKAREIIAAYNPNERLREALVNAKYALEYWQREARTAVKKGERWIDGPLSRGLDEIERIDSALSPLPQGEN